MGINGENVKKSCKKGRQHFSCGSPCFGFFVCPWYNSRTHYPTLKKRGAQNIAAFENQGKQHELSDH